MKKNIHVKLLLGVLLSTIVGIGCKKYLQLDAPETKISTQSAYASNSSATAVITGLYAQLSDNYINSWNLPATSFYEELSADNLVLFDPPGNSFLASYYQNKLTPQYTDTYNQTYWTNTYKLLYTINTSISALTDNNALAPAISRRLLGEAYFLRAFCYFYLVNLYGDVPLILTDDYRVNVMAGRTSTIAVYEQILADLKKAETFLDNNYAALDVSKITTERVRPNLAAVYSLEARAYLYQKNYSAAEASASKVINQSGQYGLEALSGVFLKNSKETIWALQPVNNGYNTREASVYLLPSEGPSTSDYPVYASASLLQSFELGDARKSTWMGYVELGSDKYWYPSKYKVQYSPASTVATEYTIVLRLAEQYLIRAEARNELGNTVGAIDDLNMLRARSRAVATTGVPNPLPNLNHSLPQNQIRSLVINERRVELFAEWGHRWFDLKRSGNIDALMKDAESYKGGIWSPYKALYPIPLSDILLNRALSQNPGYVN